MSACTKSTPGGHGVGVTGGAVVQHDHLVALGEHQPGDDRADVAGAADDQRLHRVTARLSVPGTHVTQPLGGDLGGDVVDEGAHGRFRPGQVFDLAFGPADGEHLQVQPVVASSACTGAWCTPVVRSGSLDRLQWRSVADPGPSCRADGAGRTCETGPGGEP